MNTKNRVHNFSCLFCGKNTLKKKAQFHTPPPGETNFELTKYQPYDRSIFQCALCGHYYSITPLNIETLYNNSYASHTYGDDHQIRTNFEKIMNLDSSQSDNFQRVQRISNFLSKTYKNFSSTLLDVGSGLGVFPFSMKKLGFDKLYCSEIDKTYVNHLKDTLGLNIFDFNIKDKSKYLFDLITFNKVCEHVPNPINFLLYYLKFLHLNGHIYIELPDGESAVKDKDGFNREEFFIEHYHIFSMQSCLLMARSLRLEIVNMGKLVEPSGKYTLFAFLKRAN